jgi:hypothetical protein
MFRAADLLPFQERDHEAHDRQNAGDGDEPGKGGHIAGVSGYGTRGLVKGGEGITPSAIAQ